MTRDADDLLLFAKVMEAGSLVGAAERLQLPKSTVSRRLTALEARLGEKLLQRTTRRLALTEFGQGVLEHARALSAEVDSALALALHRQQQPSGRLRVSMPADFAHLMAGPAIEAFLRDHPQVQLELDLSPRRVDLIAEGFDLAIRMGSLPDDSQLAARRLALVQGGLYASPDYLARQGEPQHPDALLHLHGLMILGRQGEALPWVLSRGDGANLEVWQGSPQQRTLANAPDLLGRLACAGLGLTLVANHFAAAYVARGQLRRVLPEWCLPAIECWAVFPGRRLLPLRTRLFIEGLERVMSEAWSPHPS
ncbi:DNA-binding transcriptional LysR family regulator [Inhella inkyongensis]|uniref:DNA-binding transcriptional LysR family regulator n=1 Tax=Inhella inkyongensis TaxID=392593 RepID=A0A840S2K1_9BURK|nr:LysR family transcriptional regulator [Inhella inkyongensis]MBB5203628.1 DNA-binding transcriptional LysR family regulator [Inhella inkyongensis]